MRRARVVLYEGKVLIAVESKTFDCSSETRTCLFNRPKGCLLDRDGFPVNLACVEYTKESTIFYYWQIAFEEDDRK